MTERRKLVYIASPYSGNVEVNTEFAHKACLYAIRCDCIPQAPHLYYTQFLDDGDPTQRKLGMEMGLQWLRMCDEIWLCGPCATAGMQAELEHAKALGLRMRRVTCEEVYAEIGAANLTKMGGHACSSTPKT